MTSVDRMRRDLLDVDHDCHDGPEDSCRWCAWIREADDKDIIVKWYEVIKESWEENVSSQNS